MPHEEWVGLFWDNCIFRLPVMHYKINIYGVFDDGNFNVTSCIVNKIHDLDTLLMYLNS